MHFIGYKLFLKNVGLKHNKEGHAKVTTIFFVTNINVC